MFACKNCGGNVKFDIKSGQLACEYCHSLFDPYAYEDKTSDAEVQKDFDATIFTCPQCGGEILSTDDTAAGFCSFCGASTVLYSRMQKEHKPAYIIPFAKSKDDCKQAYMSLMKKAIFAPKELKDPKFIDGFRGIYMPYWTYYVTQKAPISLPAKRSHRSGDYIITDHYRLEGDLDAYYKGLSYDASSSFDDSISEKLAPYDVKNMKRFTPAFLSGFYADTADLPSTIYASDAMDAACTNTVSEISKEPAFTGLSVDSDSAALSPLSLGTTVKETDYSMFPVWFLSYRNKDRVAYATVNGQTGKVVADLPISVGKFLHLLGFYSGQGRMPLQAFEQLCDLPLRELCGLYQPFDPFQLRILPTCVPYAACFGVFNGFDKCFLEVFVHFDRESDLIFVVHDF